ncbi:MAG: DUF4440 domain-containing protein [Gemmatimonadales bacterium]|nr:DUF4440 domain-containing protein [Gemmatimonadales bacterium]
MSNRDDVRGSAAGDLIQEAVVLRRFPTALAVLVAACLPTGERVLTEAERRATEDTVRQLMASMQAAANARDVDRLMTHYSPVGTFAAQGTLLTREGVYTNLKSYYGTLRELDFQWQRLEVDVLSPDAATLTGLAVSEATDTAGNRLRGRRVYTGVLARRGGQWQIVNWHLSMPPDPSARRE